MDFPATLLCDFYKISHREQYPKGTEYIYSTWTPRTSRIKEIDKVVVFGIQYFLKEYLVEYFRKNFFFKPLEEIVEEYTRVLRCALGKEVREEDYSHVVELHNLGYLPLEVKALPEGTRCPIRTPILSIQNTDPKFFWLTNYIETLMSCTLWTPMTSATIASHFKKILDKWAKKTGEVNFTPFQGHDFSMRGLSSLQSSTVSGAAHLLSFVGTDTIPAILFLEKYYNADLEKELVGTSIPATEHSVMSAHGEELLSFKKLITETYPSGMVSIVSDTWDFWKVIEEVLPVLKEDILKRDGKVVIRPDSGDPANILCGYNPDLFDEGWVGSECVAGCVKQKEKFYRVEMTNENRLGWKLGKEIPPLEQKGLIECLWNIFGGKVNKKGYKELDPHIGAIYGDAITYEKVGEICERLEKKGFASTNIVFGIGSYTYQYRTRDTFGFAMKATHAKINGKDKMLFKDPKTDSGVKKSQRGKVVIHDNLTFSDGLNSDKGTLMRTVFKDGRLFNETSLREIKEKLYDND